MPKEASLGYAAIATILAVMETKGVWDIWDIGCAAMIVCAIACLIWGD